ncbi:MAG: CSLREA domain-containing protein, partial [Vicinamibacterales bacterium]
MSQMTRLPMAPSRVLLIAALLFGSILAILPLQIATAQTHTYDVNSTADTSDATPGDDVCLTAGSVCTLRAAIEEANHANNTGSKFITVYQAGTYALGSQLVITGSDID